MPPEVPGARAGGTGGAVTGRAWACRAARQEFLEGWSSLPWPDGAPQVAVRNRAHGCWCVGHEDDAEALSSASAWRKEALLSMQSSAASKRAFIAESRI